MRPSRLLTLVALVVSVTALAACAVKIKRQFDPELGRTITHMNRNKIGRSGSYTLYVNGVMIEEAESARYAIWVEARGLDWVRADNLTLFVDGRELDLGRGERFDADVTCFTRSNLGASLGMKPVDRCNFREVYEYDATEEQLLELAAATRVVMRMTGYEISLLKSFSDGNIARFRHFVSEYVPRADPPVLRRGEGQ